MSSWCRWFTTQTRRRTCRTSSGFVSRVTAVRVPTLRNYVRSAVTLLGDTPLTHGLLDAPEMTAVLTEACARQRPDVVFAYCSGMARFALSPPLDGIPLVLDLVDVDSRKWSDMAAASRPPLAWLYRREAATLGAFERRAAERATAALVVNAREATIARALAPAANVRVLNNGVELDRLRPPDASGRFSQGRVLRRHELRAQRRGHAMVR